MTKIIYRIGLTYGLFAERMFYQFGVEIFPIKWRIALNELSESVI